MGSDTLPALFLPAGEGANFPPSARSVRVCDLEAVRSNIPLKMYADCIILTQLGVCDEYLQTY